MTDQVKCIDCSHWQNFPDFEQVRASGVIAMIHKATEGDHYIDPNRADNIARAMDAGIACCTYHWLSPEDSPSKQMQFYIDTVDPVPGERMIIDYEETGCTLDGLKEAVAALKRDSRGLQVTVYSGHLLKEQLGSSCDEYLAENTDLWLAQYTTGTPTWPSGTYATWTLWQYSEEGQIDGIEGSYVDLNRFNGSDADLLDWITPTDVPRPKLVPVSVAFKIPGNVDLTITVNGTTIMGT